MLPLTVALIAALCSVAVCQDEEKLYITADNSLKEVCVQGTNVPLKSLPLMEQADVASRLDRMPMPAGWNDDGQGCIAVRARNSNPRTWGGILACIKGPKLVNLFWQCVELPELAGASCCSSCANPIWDLPSSSNILKMLPNEHRKKDFVKKLPEMCTAVKDQTNWVWANNRLQPEVCCRSAPCAPLCDACDTAGPAKCDLGKCRFDATGVASPVCKSKCYVKAEIFYPGNGVAFYPKAEITNGATGEVYKLPFVNNQFAFMIDIATCRPAFDSNGDECAYGTDDSTGTTAQVNLWASTANGPLTGSFIIDLASGSDVLHWLGVQQSNGDGGFTDTDMYGRDKRAVSFTLTGYTGDLTTQVLSEEVTELFANPPPAP